MQSMQGIGYKELIPVVDGSVGLNDAVWQIVLHTCHYAKRQVTWLKTEPRVVWMAEDEDKRFDCAMRYIDTFTKGTKQG
jgi:tRNA dimethylallyltransferase